MFRTVSAVWLPCLEIRGVFEIRLRLKQSISIAALPSVYDL
ncbi:hypothetical protein [Yeguia hominis]|nr:hypothetical protein [Yeguia hominis]